MYEHRHPYLNQVQWFSVCHVPLGHYFTGLSELFKSGSDSDRDIKKTDYCCTYTTIPHDQIKQIKKAPEKKNTNSSLIKDLSNNINLESKRQKFSTHMINKTNNYNIY